MASRGPAYRAALCGVLAALAAAVMTLGTAVPVGTFCCPALAGLLMIPVLDLFGTWAGLGWYAAVAALSLLLAPDREAALVYLFFGWYPALRPLLQRVRPRALRLLSKLLVYGAAAGVLYGLLGGLLGLTAELADAAAGLAIALALLGAVTFLLCDFLLDRMTLLWRRDWKKRLHK